MILVCNFEKETDIPSTSKCYLPRVGGEGGGGGYRIRRAATKLFARGEDHVRIRDDSLYMGCRISIVRGMTKLGGLPLPFFSFYRNKGPNHGLEIPIIAIDANCHVMPCHSSYIAT